MSGGNGNDNYHFGKGDGQDTVDMKTEVMEKSITYICTILSFRILYFSKINLLSLYDLLITFKNSVGFRPYC